MTASPRSRGPVLLVVAGVLLLVLGAVLIGVATLGLVRTATGGVLGSDGGPGSDVVAVAATEGTTTVSLDAGAWDVWLVTTTAAPSQLDGTLAVAGCDASVTVPGGEMTMTLYRREAVRVARLTAPVAGACELVVPPTLGAVPAEVYLTPATEPAELVGGIVGGAGGIAAGALLLTAGLGLGIGGLVWFFVGRRSPGRPAGGAPPPPPSA